MKMFKVLVEGCEPTKGSKYSAAVDLYASEDVVIGVGETVKVPLGVCIDEDKIKEIISNMSIYSLVHDKFSSVWGRIYDEFFNSHYLQLEPRSSLRAKGLIAGTGIIDLDYKDEIMIILHNPLKDTDYTVRGNMTIEFEPDNTYGGYKISKGQKIAQILLKEHKTYLMGIETSTTRNGGFGSTGK